MKKKSIQISIPEPCDQKFKNMTPTNGGRHCAQCDKVLVDFSLLTDREIVNLIKKNKGKLCGHFRKSQLNRDISWMPPKVNSTRGKAAGLLLTSMLSGGMLEAQNQLLFPQNTESQIVISNEKTLVDEFLEKEKEEKITISGTIADETGEALIGANVTLKGKQGIGTSADIDGNFSLKIAKNELEKGIALIFNYTGYNTIEINYNLENIISKEKITITMNEGIILGEMVVVGYYSSETTLPHWEPEGNWLLDIEKGIKKLVQKFRTKRKNRNARKLKILKLQHEESISQNENIKITEPNISDYSFKINNVFPNPFSSEIKIEVDSEKENEFEISINDVNGKVIYFAKEKTKKGLQEITINLQNYKISNGTYFLKIQNSEGFYQTKKLSRIITD